MKPKVRNRQAQYGRLSLRGNDHRDVVYNDYYINAMWLNKDDADKLIWNRTPHEYWISCPWYYNNVSGGVRGLGILDMDREIHHCSAWGGTRTASALLKLKDYVVAVKVQSGYTFINATKNGGFWQRVGRIWNAGLYWYRFGFNGIAKFDKSTNKNSFTFKIGDVTDDSDGFPMVESFTDYTITFPETMQSLNYICDTANGMLVSAIPQNQTIKNVKIYEVTKEGANYWSQILVSNTSYFNGYYLKGVKKGSFYALVTESKGIANGVYYDNVVVYASSDRENWTGTTLLMQSSSSGYPTTPNFQICQRNGWFYVYIIAYNVLTIKKSQNGTDWIDVSYPDYVDVDCMTDGVLVSDTYEKVRLVLNPSATIPTSDNVLNMTISSVFPRILSEQFAYLETENNIKIKDGEFVIDEDFIGFSGVTGGTKFASLYFDSMNFASSANNYAFVCKTSIVSSDGAEEIMQGDYCVSSKGHTYPAWNEDTYYSVGEIVTYGGLWKSLVSNNNHIPSGSSYWTKYR